MWPLDAPITGLAHDGSCTSSHLSPCLHIENLFPPSLHLLFFPFLPHPPVAKKLRNVFFRALACYSRNKSPSLGKAPVFEHSRFGDVQQLFLRHQNPPTSKLFPEASHIPSWVTLLFCPSNFHPLSCLARTLRSAGVKIRLYISTCFRVRFCRLASVHQVLVSVFAAHKPNIFGTKLKLLNSDPLLSPCRPLPTVILPHLPSLCLESSRNHCGP